jgi:hypothetical protein
MNNVKLKIDEPVVISQAPPEVREWGYWQFPGVEKADNGNIHVSYDKRKDSVTSYGLPLGHVVSRDNGITWEEVNEFDGYGIKAVNGDRLLIYIPKSIKLSGIDLPEHVACIINYNIEYSLYTCEDLPGYMGEWFMLRKKAGEKCFKKEKINVKIPGHLMMAGQGVLARNFFWRMRSTPDENICAIIYRSKFIDGEVTYSMARFLLSEDNGYNWELGGEIPYEYESGYDDIAEKRYGFTEPDITFLPDGSAFCLLRTTDGNGVGPMYWSKSMDNMRTWSKPKYFDRLGVWPQLLTLGNGVTLASYGRPGIFIRATADPEGLVWDEPVEVIKPGVYGFEKDTCSYTGMAALDSDTALLVYSDFNYPDEEGVRRKTILARTITVK